MKASRNTVLRNFYAGKRVFITGHTGFKGSWLMQWLLQLGAKVAGYSLDFPSTPNHFNELGLKDCGRHANKDIRNATEIAEEIREFAPEVVFHLAGQPLVRKSYEDPKSTIEVNVNGMVNILEAIRHTPGILAAVLITSDKCYENVEWEYGYRETDPLGGRDPYSSSKACAELIFRSYADSFFLKNHSCRVASARAGNVIGGGDWAKDRLVPDLVRMWSQEKVPLIRYPGATRPWQHVLESLSAYLWLGVQLAEKAPRVNGESFNFGPSPGTSFSVLKVIDEMAKHWRGQRVEIEGEDSGKLAEAGLLQLNSEKATKRLQWKTVLSFEETIAFTAKWYRDYYGKARSAQELTQAQIEEYEELAQERNVIWSRPNL